jgi:hypothetical protein
VEQIKLDDLGIQPRSLGICSDSVVVGAIKKKNDQRRVVVQKEGRKK